MIYKDSLPSNLEVGMNIANRKWILGAVMVLILAFSLPAPADSVPPSFSQDLNTPEPDATATLEPPVPAKPAYPYREWVEPTRTPPNRAVYTVGFTFAAVIVIGMILLGYYILKRRDKSPK